MSSGASGVLRLPAGWRMRYTLYKNNVVGGHTEANRAQVRSDGVGERGAQLYPHTPTFCHGKLTEGSSASKNRLWPARCIV